MSGEVVKFGIIKVENYGYRDQRGRFTNTHFGRYFNWLIDYMGDPESPLNRTMTDYEAIGDLNRTTGNYSGIIGGLQSGDIDISVMPFYYPLEDVEESFAYTPPVHEDTMTMFSVYYKTDDKVSKDLIQMFEPVPLSLWFGLFMTFLVLVRLLDFANRLLGKKNQPSSWWLVFRAYLNDDNFIWDTPFYVIYAFFASTTIFFAMNFLLSSMSTDLVVYDKPETFSTYEELLSQKSLKIGFPSLSPEYKKFSEAPKNTIHWELFKQEFSLGMQDTDKYGQMALFLENRTLVFIAREMLIRTMALLNAATQSKDNARGSQRILLAKDPHHAMKYSNVFAYRKMFAKEKRMIKCVYRFVESGLMNFGFIQAPEMIAEALLPPGTSISPSIKRLLSYEIEKTDEKYENVKFINVTYFLSAIAACMILSAIVLAKEMFEEMLFKHFVLIKDFICKLSMPELSFPKLPITFKFRTNKVSPTQNLVVAQLADLSTPKPPHSIKKRRIGMTR